MTDSVSEPVIESELRRHGVYATCAVGTSMRPMLGNRRDVVIVVPPSAPPKKYDVVLYRDRERYVLHRVVAVKSTEYVIRGDNTYFREHVAPEQIIGVLSSFDRKGKRFEASSRLWAIYARVWTFIYPVRFALHYVASFFRRAFVKIFRRRNKYDV